MAALIPTVKSIENAPDVRTPGHPQYA